ncbi:MAG: circadian clock KaiB family protein, partial [Thermoanaerobaculia bacterium]
MNIKNEIKGILKLFIVQNGVNSKKSMAFLNSIFEKYLKEDYKIEIIDVNKNKEEAIENGLMVIPNLILYKNDQKVFLPLFLENEKDFFFTYSVIESISLRHNKYGNSVKLLEPNIKNSAGGLRDLHD